YGIECGSPCGAGTTCVDGHCTPAFHGNDLGLGTISRATGEARVVPPLTVTETATESSPGALAGSFGVNARGVATYTIPIVVPPGRAGMEPAVSLDYSGRSPNGILGMGWSIGGLSAISRCPKIAAEDGWAVGVTYGDADRFCLDGRLLVLAKPGTYGAPGTEYRTELDTFDKIELEADGGQ